MGPPGGGRQRHKIQLIEPLILLFLVLDVFANDVLVAADG
jgi:hypothetical protein